LMIWLMPGAHHARIWVIGLIAWCLAAAELTHIIAGSVDALFAVMSGVVAVTTYIVNFAIPVLVGNTVGGLVFVAVLNHRQVAADDAAEKRSDPHHVVVDPADR
jgi:formate-nitrite transporter family protein